MYSALERLGFTGGRVIEPALGAGHFIGHMPPTMKSNSRITGVEIDDLTGRIANKLYPEADIRIQGFEKVKFPDNYFDLAISNVPFGDYKLHDPRYDKLKLRIHDYFFAKSLDIVRPGGLVMFVTSKGTLDKKDSYVRDYMAKRAELIGAIRLPNDAFKKNANTEVTTDIVILRKYAEGEKPKSEPK
ncbi:MAG: class I SAM-dependent methyltransferase, partial [Nitrospinae bacterium]|nr:class I SAM-dependent methyltransferase [Nitrospinota bacterium]